MEDDKSTSSKLSKRFKIKKSESSSSKVSLESKKGKKESEKIPKERENLKQDSKVNFKESNSSFKEPKISQKELKISQKESKTSLKEPKSSLKESATKTTEDIKKILKLKKPSATSLQKLNKSSSETIFDRSTKPNISSMNADDSLMYGIDRVICLWNYVQQSIKKN